MKKIGLIIGLLLISLAGCNNNSNDNEKTDTSIVLEEKTYRGSSTLTWHTNETFVAMVDVTILGNKITKVEIVDGSYITTGSDSFKLWDEEEFLSRFIGKTVEEINALEANDPVNPSNHFDGGSLSGSVDVIAGATASSTVVAKAVKQAVLKTAILNALN